MFCPRNNFTYALDFGKDRIGSSSPDEWAFVNVVVLDVALDLQDQLAHAVKRSAADCLLRDQPEPALDLIEPA